MQTHRPTVTRRGLASGLSCILSTVSVFTAQPVAASVPELVQDPIFALIEAHRLAVAKDRKAGDALARARLIHGPAVVELTAERKRTCKLRHNRRRDLRRATPTTAAGFRALRAYYQTLIPMPDIDDVATRCAADFVAAVARFEGRASR
ncbi:hypothetical protein BGCPKDLD_3862 [Methylorubrum suomiense]|uniref:TIGR02301 family protein n=1 Tax=Methylorubrum suomiense TaxID=144191 RepID=A0ABQ4V0U0_9HYPH|nr:hypothetical protein BGCPKDLD_3862 [Methylorubrum suomiense]